MKYIKTLSVIAVLLFSVSTIMYCAKEDKSGRLGIVVPIGKGKVTKDTPYLITGVYEGSPSHAAGVKPDDVIIQIDDKKLEGMEYDYIYNELLLGKPDSVVTLVVMRNNKQFVFEIKRGR